MPGMFKYMRRRIAAAVAAALKDPYWNMVSMLLRAKTGATTGQQNNTFVDSSTNNFTITRAGNVTQGSFSPYAGAGGSMYFDGTGDYLDVPVHANLTLGANNFTAEAWVYPTAVSDNAIFTLNSIVAGYAALHIRIKSTGVLTLAMSLAGGGWDVNSDSTVTVPQKVWSHVAVVRNGTAVNVYLNGASVISATASGTLMNGVTQIFNSIGKYGSTPNFLFNGYISDARVVIGTAVYTGTFVPPSAPLTAIANTKLLLSGTNANVQNVAGTSDLETVGTAAVNTTVKKFTNGSVYFNGTSDQLSVPGSSGFVFGTENFTVELWYFQTATSNQQTLIDVRGSAVASPWTLNIFGPASATAPNSISFYDGVAHKATSGFTPTLNTWTHVAITRGGGFLKIFVNGVQFYSAANAVNLSLGGTGKILIGNGWDASVRFAGYIEDLRITKGVARYLTDFTPPTADSALIVEPTSGDPYYSQTVLHMHMDGPNDGTVFADQKGHSGTLYSGLKLKTAQAKFGQSSAFQDIATTGCLSITPVGNEFQYGTGDFTIEAWVYNSSASWATGTFVISDQNIGYASLLYTVNVLTFGSVAGGAMSANAWHHIAASRRMGVMRLFIDGVQTAVGTDTTNYTGSNQFRIGANGNGINRFGGYIDEVRVTKGVARYTSNFTVPAAAFPDYQDFTADPYIRYSMLLKGSTNLGQNNTVLDSSTNNFTVTRSGDVTQGTFSPFSNSGFSGAFGMGSCSLTTATNAVLNMSGAATFTVEGWAFLTDSNSLSIPFEQSGSTGSSFVVYFSTNLLQAGAGNFTKTAQSIPQSQWFHWAVTKSGNTITPFVNGIKGTAISVAITAATNAANVGGRGATYSVPGNLSNVRMVNSVIYTVDFAVPTTPLTAIAGTLLLTLQDNRFKDNSSNAFALTVTGSPAIQAFSPFATTTYSAAANGGSLYFDGTGDILSIVATGNLTGDFTIEFWAYAITTNNTGLVYSYDGAGTECGAYYYNGTLYWKFGYQTQIGVAMPSTNQWHHYSMSRTGSALKCYLDGVLSASATNSQVAGYGAYWKVNDTGAFNGYVSGVRIINGTGLYPAAFTPPTAPPTAVTNTQLLLSGTNAAITDPTGKLVVETLGDAKVDMVNKRYSGSLKFDGTGDYLVTTGNNLCTFGAGDFTIELWYQASALGSAQALYEGRPGANGAFPFLMKLAANTMQWYVNTAGQITGTTAVVAGTWYHIAVSRVGGTTRLFVNGIQEGISWTDATVYSSGAGYPRIGADYTAGALLNGYIEDLRVTKGIGRYPANFTPPLAALPSV